MTDTEQQETSTGPAAFDPDAAAELLGLNAKQKAWCIARLKGANKSQAAKAAGYTGSPESIRQRGVEVSRSPKVIEFMKLAELEGGGQLDPNADLAELKKILSRRARGQDGPVSNRAIELLDKIYERERAAKEDGVFLGDPRETLKQIAAIDLPMALRLAAETHFPIGAELEAAARDGLRKYHCPICAARIAREIGLTLEEVN